MTTPAAHQSLQAITLAQWLPVLQRWLGLRHALVVGHSQQALSLLNSDPEALTLFKSGSPDANPVPTPAAHALSSHAAVHTRPWLIAEHTGPATFHQASLPSESGLLPATALTACWPGIRSMGQQQAQALSMDDACAQASAEHSWACPPQWLWIGCLPATSLLRGATQVLQQLVVVALRVQLHTGAHPDASLPSAQALLQAQGFALCGVQHERNPYLGTALFVRDYPGAHSAIRQQCDELAQAHAELQAQLIAETKAKQAEAETRFAAQQQVQSLAQATEQALAQKQVLLQEITSLQQAHGQQSEALRCQVESLNDQVHALQSQAINMSQQLEQSQQLKSNTQDELSRYKTRIEDLFTKTEAQIDLIKELVLVEHTSLNNADIDHDWASELGAQVFGVPDQEVGEPGGIDKNLLQRTITQWQFGDWDSLSQLNRDAIQHHPDRAKLALLGSAGRLQTDQIDEAKQYIRLAKDWGVSKKLLTRILAAGVHNSLGRAASLAGEQQLAIQHFQSALATGTPGSEARLFVQARISHQYQHKILSPVANASLSNGVPPTPTFLKWETATLAKNNNVDNLTKFNQYHVNYQINHPQEFYVCGSPEEEATKGSIDKYLILDEIHQILSPSMYLEIGVFDGRSLTLSKCESIGIDPDPKINTVLKPNVAIFKCTSDEFFYRHSGIIKNKPDLFFIDGLHFFENALRDFINVERWSKHTSVVLIDDVYPNHPSQALRKRKTISWTGDVWKLYEILRNYRPDLTLISIDANPTGLLIVGGLDPDNTILYDNYNAIVNKYYYYCSPPEWILDRRNSFSFNDPAVACMLSVVNKIKKAS